MLYHLFYALADYFSGFNVFQYLTFRSAGALVTAIVIGLVIGQPMIRWLKSLQPKGQPIRDDGPQHHLIVKTGTPTMGGLLILLSMTISTLLWANLTNPFVWLVLFITLGFGLIGFYDDFFKVRRQSSKGLSGKQKLLLQSVIALVVLLIFTYIYQGKDLTYLYVPFFKDFFINLGWFFIPFAIFVIVGTSNAVNLTDGLDGLAIVPAMIVASCFALIAYLAGNSIFANYLQIQYVPGIGEIAVLCGAMIGAGLSFLWFNAPPASVFMGDTGSLAMGGALGAISVMTKHEIVLAIIGGLFVIEAVSVIVQVVSFQTTGKRVFRMAPLHHHFEQKGWAESTIVIRFWIVALILAMIGLATLKLR